MKTNADLIVRRENAVAKGIATAAPIYVQRAQNSTLWDVQGRRFIDFAGGIAVLNTGHCHPKIIAAANEQMQHLTHSAFQVAAYEPYVTLCERLNAVSPINGKAKTVLFSTGAEAVENAVKIARAATGRSGIIAFSGGFHGRTMMTMALTGKVVPYKGAFGPMPAEVYHAPFPIARYGIDVQASLNALTHLFRADIAPDRVAAIIIEPVQGEGGFHAAPIELMQALRKICDQHGIMLIADEVQTGFGRTGKLFAIEHSDIAPDMLVAAKSLAGGFPLSAVIGRADVMDSVGPGGLGGTYSGSPIACAAALAVLDVIEDENLLNRSVELGKMVKQRLNEFAANASLRPMDAIRGLGSMVAFDLVTKPGGNTPDAAAAKAVTAKAFANGLILLSCGVSGETIRLLYPLTISDETLNEGLHMLENALEV
ncbi:MAG: 4-aminobutyrate--2-oxoglutarate transaminase [Robiginitomaculum sp.]|nr:4-aminobutyrate--2-oxoglutarate transaminase [Robiginitomaculum sp.]